jgi:hypothetical protein
MYGAAFVVATTAVDWKATNIESPVAYQALFQSPDAEAKSCANTGERKTVENESPKSPLISPLLMSLKVEGYYLLWSPGAWKKLLFGCTTLFLAHAVGHSFLLANAVENSMLVPPSTYGHSPVLRSMIANVILPLLASACCSLQLAMNLFAIGCAGFNTVLGPVRPYFISLMLYLTVISRNSRHVDAKHWAATTALRWSISLLPEALHLWNSIKSSYKMQVDRDDVVVYEKINTNDVPTRKLVATVQMDIPTMGCVACIASIDNALRQTSKVEYAASSLRPLGAKGGQAEVKIVADTQEEVDAIVGSLTAVVAQTGFPDSVIESVRVRVNKNRGE